MKKLKDANPRASTAKIGKIDPSKTVFNPNRDDSTDALAKQEKSRIVVKKRTSFRLFIIKNFPFYGLVSIFGF